MRLLSVTFKNIKKFIQHKPFLFAFLVISQIVCVIVVFLVCGFVDNANRESKVIQEGANIFWINLTNYEELEYSISYNGENTYYIDSEGNVYTKEEIADLKCPEGYFSDVCYLKNFKPKMEEFIKFLGDNYSGIAIFGQVDDKVASISFLSGLSKDESEISKELSDFNNSNKNIMRISTSDCESVFGKKPVVGDKVNLGGQEYTISIIDEDIAGIDIPYNSIPDNFLINTIAVYTVEPCTPKESSEISEKIKELFQTENFDTPEPRVLDEVQNIQLAYGITAAVIIMIILNISRVYSYVLTYRKKSFAIMNICGASKRKIFLIYLVELMLTLIVTFGIALLIFHMLILQPIAVSYPNFLISMTLQTYLIIFGIYFVVAVLIMSLTISRFISKSAVEMERSGD
ncbi:FtsX-like permease family protein [Pseudoruminococcus massiliensis]|uniref:FtsX-like permease family protein n=1 Tax=Pseudoruminococcus massiliensis TaxID=2086583 RepID=UPI000D1142B0|nr:FtsX-like permease family protein [Pseudoruminococcus massiliensis]